MKRMIEVLSDRFLDSVAPKAEAAAACGGYYQCCKNGRLGLRRLDPDRGLWCTPCYTTEHYC